jgi:hypothetical protein
VKIVVRIEKVAADQYLLDGKSFDSFLNARREMAERMKHRRLRTAVPNLTPRKGFPQGCRRVTRREIRQNSVVSGIEIPTGCADTTIRQALHRAIEAR